MGDQGSDRIHPDTGRGHRRFRESEVEQLLVTLTTEAVKVQNAKT